MFLGPVHHPTFLQPPEPGTRGWGSLSLESSQFQPVKGVGTTPHPMSRMLSSGSTAAANIEPHRRRLARCCLCFFLKQLHSVFCTGMYGYFTKSDPAPLVRQTRKWALPTRVELPSGMSLRGRGSVAFAVKTKSNESPVVVRKKDRTLFEIQTREQHEISRENWLASDSRLPDVSSSLPVSNHLTAHATDIRAASQWAALFFFCWGGLANFC